MSVNSCYLRILLMLAHACHSRRGIIPSYPLILKAKSTTTAKSWGSSTALASITKLAKSHSRKVIFHGLLP
ncbi:hypothetical protein BAUCODRAFT_391918 [Baudoinia panamericana UAMH 10762]|uniref:Secreted protein n=1 Tax=Baudoinia panamericana (strain UAMH 10762) TaxID=717646 RepID=M2LWS3_BAUPA|nr:uncharacterized protein BAUCODRAFT_391918 [Baudoinia panamericana UAMH 10762]EMC99117.1 hypothetical protein BAUCODRAFT_391918 [Baudoinia panamericana UAMH 10762]